MEGARLATAVQLPDGKEAVYAGCDLEPMFLLCRATVFRGNGAGSAAHYSVGTGAWGTG